MDGQSVGAGISLGLAFLEDTRQKLEALRDELRSTRRDLDGLGRRVTADK